MDEPARFTEKVDQLCDIIKGWSHLEEVKLVSEKQKTDLQKGIQPNYADRIEKECDEKLADYG